MESPGETDHFSSVYARAYDAMYRDKDYEAECDFLEEVFRRCYKGMVRSVLDLGCGTGGHALPLARRGYQVWGVDHSAQMIAIAREKARAAKLAEQVHFEVADICSLDLQRTFDVAICIFAVLSYQISNEALMAALCSARRHLAPGGLFISDFWYGPAVLAQRPSERVKIVQDGTERLVRITRPQLDTERNMVRVWFHIMRLREREVIEEADEEHRLRYFFCPELEFYLAQAGFAIEQFCPFLQLDERPDERTWNVTLIARAR
ncbi:MAG: class I SAM-dependent methyltransferase [Anaerolineae bacterium]|nr:class I SAM-dependent methyltransferase [Anaerolineae bacterium]MDW8070194.1 class I SAM-dependent methyltransferase [Anaerolineae bacterium]